MRPTNLAGDGVLFLEHIELADSSGVHVSSSCDGEAMDSIGGTDTGSCEGEHCSVEWEVDLAEIVGSAGRDDVIGTLTSFCFAR